ncbi:hypothetical protein [Sphingorhabdus sp. Alg231-15]|uniref:hypothetical protein n=1 Tax=Sphingorhabdus sp. Alg231-15 TaxID=1922222 RepID=UPI00307B258D
MKQTATDLIATLDRMEKRLKRIECHQSAARLERLSVARLALNLRRECSRSFPAQYFCVDSWDILLELYTAHKMNRIVKISMHENDPVSTTTNALRYIDMLMKDGLLYLEHGHSDDGEDHAFLTQKGLEHLEAVFEKSKRCLTIQS